MQTHYVRRSADGSTEIKYKINHNWQKIELGDPIVSDFIKNDKGELIPFLYKPLRPDVEPDRTICPLGGTLAMDLCWPYGELEGTYASIG